MTEVGVDSPSSQSDNDLLEIAEIVLRGAGYQVRRDAVDDFPCLYAENADAALILACPLNIQKLVSIEPILSQALAKTLSGTATSKRWDGYAVMLSNSSETGSANETLGAIANDLRHVRRIVRVGVAPTAAGVSRALRPLLPLPRSTEGGLTLSNPIDALRSLLLRDGVDAEYLDRALTIFSASSSIGMPEQEEFGED